MQLSHNAALKAARTTQDPTAAKYRIQIRQDARVLAVKLGHPVRDLEVVFRCKILFGGEIAHFHWCIGGYRVQGTWYRV